MTHFRAFIVALALLLGPVAAAQAQTDPLVMNVRVGFDGYVQAGDWVPIHVTASNDGEDITGELRVEVATLSGTSAVYTRPIDLPQGSRKVVTVYVNEVTSFNDEIRVDLVRRGRVLLTEAADIEYIREDVLLVGQWSDNAAIVSGFGDIFANPSEAAVGFLTVDDLPDVAPAWSALDVLVVADVDTGELSVDQRAALDRWVAAGGRLIVAGGVNYQRVISGLDGLLPFQPQDTAELDVTPIAAAGRTDFAPSASTQVPAAVGSLVDDAQVLLTDPEGAPLIVYRAYGSGRVDYITADLSLEPLRSWEGFGELWRFILADSEARPAWAYGFNSQWDSARTAVAALPGVSLPSVLQLCGFLVLYVLLVGPINYLVLWRLKKRELAWFTIPGLVLLFSVVAYLTGFQLRGTQAIVHRLAVVQTFPQTETVRVEGLMGVWSPRRSNYDVQLSSGLLAYPLPREITGNLINPGQVTVESGVTSTNLRDVQVDIGSISPFVIEGFLEGQPRLTGSVELEQVEDGLRVSGDVINETPLDFTDAIVIFAGTVTELRDLPAGEVLRIDEVVTGGAATSASGSGLQPFPPQANSGNFYYYNYNPTINALAGGCAGIENPRRCGLAASILNGEGRDSKAYFIAWTDSVPYETNFLNAGADTEDLSMYIAELETTFTGEAESGLEVPPGLMTWTLLESNGYAEYTPYDLYVGPGEEFVFRFAPLSIVPTLDTDSMIVTIEQRYDDLESTPDLEARSQATGAWVSLGNLQWGTNLIEDVGGLIGADGTVDLRISSSSGVYYSLQRLDVTLVSN